MKLASSNEVPKPLVFGCARPGLITKTRIGRSDCCAAARAITCRAPALIRSRASLLIGSSIVKNCPGFSSERPRRALAAPAAAGRRPRRWSRTAPEDDEDDQEPANCNNPIIEDGLPPSIDPGLGRRGGGRGTGEGGPSNPVAADPPLEAIISPDETPRQTPRGRPGFWRDRRPVEAGRSGRGRRSGAPAGRRRACGGAAAGVAGRRRRPGGGAAAPATLRFVAVDLPAGMLIGGWK